MSGLQRRNGNNGVVRDAQDSAITLEEASSEAPARREREERGISSEDVDESTTMMRLAENKEGDVNGGSILEKVSNEEENLDSEDSRDAEESETEDIPTLHAKISNQAENINVKFSAMRDLKSQIQALQRQLQPMEDELRPMKDDMEETISAYSQKLSMEIARAVHSAFPREIRDLIYGHILSSYISLYISTPNSCDWGLECKVRLSFLRDLLSAQHADKLLLPTWFGLLAEEFTQYYYAHASFKLHSNQMVWDLFTSTISDPNNHFVDVVPANHIRRLRVMVPAESDDSEQTRTAQVTYLSLLLMVRNPRGIELAVSVQSYHGHLEKGKCGWAMLKTIGPVLFQLRDAGFGLNRVTWISKYEHADEKNFTEELGGFLEQGEVKWVESMNAHIAKCEKSNEEE
ncbi:hypothetical protein K505DRAFT_416444 [Melanomma pulvis-pyrius CBS 109.77]|uniref:Uncharacterized protein n=1 Tax=Melanomma pulvis-pyrius CBS 109.77 TaxID=1314802 RepID=A0A6A6XGZ4_9PLEO|nr:hypothetical protein K505DRAFT_416444 [Melanomma pulvis-pyrius CBS 109.77]